MAEEINEYPRSGVLESIQAEAESSAWLNQKVMAELTTYRLSESEQARERSLVSLFGQGARALDIGARDGHYTRLLAEHYSHVVALDLAQPDIPGAECLAGDVTALQFPDRSFDFILCAEVLEHIPAIEAAAREIARVAADRVLIGVPYRQDTRLGRLTCSNCGKINPPWGHVNEFDEARLRQLFSSLEVESIHFVGENRARTNALSTWLLDLVGNPWGTYYQDEACSGCDQRLAKPGPLPLWAKVPAKLAIVLNNIQARFNQPHGNWIHIVFRVPRTAR
jgi:SAM-dependent methyltransferase